MSASDSGSWKLIVYPLIIIILLGTILTEIARPFISEGINIQNNPNTFTTILNNSIADGVPFSLTILSYDITTPLKDLYHLVTPNDMLLYLSDMLNSFTYLPLIIQFPILLIISFCIIYGIVILIGMFIP